MSEVRLIAYVDGEQQAAAVTKRVAELCAPLEVTPQLTVVDVSQDPHAAEAANVIGTPTLVLEAPPPRKRVIGFLDDDERVRAALGLDRWLPVGAEGAGS